MTQLFGGTVRDKFEGIVERGSPEDFLLRQIDFDRLPRHVAVIMDGNGRWANRRSKPRVSGHRAGASAVRETVETAARMGISYLTLYAFSTENWKRPRLEIETLMRLLRQFLSQELDTLRTNDIRFRVMGRREGLSAGVLRDIERAERETSGMSGMLLNVALNYSGRAEIVDACRRLVAEALATGRDPATLTEEDVERNLYAPEVPHPDLLIRTSGEMRVSNFMMWQIAYTEIHVTETLWPDFRRANLFEAVIEYQKRERRYGGIADPVDDADAEPVAGAGAVGKGTR
jgi:undecaprenyl diphosphate synthase